MHSLPIFVRLRGREVILLGEGEVVEAKRRLLQRAGAVVVQESPDARLAVVAISDEAEACQAVERLRARGVLVNAVDRPELCDFTLPAIVDRDPVLVAVATGGVSSGLAAALRQRLEAILPVSLGKLAMELRSARDEVRRKWPESTRRRLAISEALADGGQLDPFVANGDGHVAAWLRDQHPAAPERVETVWLRSNSPDDLTLRDARLIANADIIIHDPEIGPAVLARARADARIANVTEEGLQIAEGSLVLHILWVS